MKVLRVFTSFILIFAVVLLNTSCLERKSDSGISKNPNINSEEEKVLEEPILFIGGEARQVKYEDVKKIRPDMTFKEVLLLLGPGKDIGSGLHVVVYKLEDGTDIIFSIGSMNQKISKSGEEIINDRKVRLP